MTKNDFFLGIGFIGTILSVGFHTIGYELKSFSELQLFLKDNSDDENYDQYLDEYEIQRLVKKYSDSQIEPLFVDDILMVMSDLPNGKALAKCFLVEEDDKYTLNQRICALSVKDKNAFSTKFLYYYLNRNWQLLKFDNGCDQTNLRKADILNIRIPIVSFPEQEHIASILDHFDSLCNDLTSGLPAEIEARRKQYEYYRDKLLSFKEMKK